MTRAQRQKSEYRTKLKAVVNTFKENPVRLPTDAVEFLLSELCVRLGYCLSLADQREILDNPPTDPYRFAILVIELEGADPSNSDNLEPVLECVCNAFLRSSRNAA